MRNDHFGTQFEPLQMFMTPHEIHQRWGPLDGDRMDAGGVTASTERTFRTIDRSGPTRSSDGQQRWRREARAQDRRDWRTRPETDDQLWERKLDEAHDDGLYDSVASEGVRHPIRLGRSRNQNDDLEVVGGHHRLAAATDIDPHRLVPVLHDENFRSAKMSSSYRYR